MAPEPLEYLKPVTGEPTGAADFATEDTLAALRAENARLREAMREIAKRAWDAQCVLFPKLTFGEIKAMAINAIATPAAPVAPPDGEAVLHALLDDYADALAEGSPMDPAAYRSRILAFVRPLLATPRADDGAALREAVTPTGRCICGHPATKHGAPARGAVCYECPCAGFRAADARLYDTFDSEPGEFHWRDGLTFTRLASGEVRIRCWRQVSTAGRWTVETLAVLPAAEWDSVVRETAARAASTPTRPEHVCGLSGFGLGFDDVCPACDAAREAYAARQRASGAGEGGTENA